MDWRISTIEGTSSVMDEMKKAGENGSPEGAVISAARQDGGRGRQGRVWVSPVGGLYAAVLLRPQFSIANISLITLLTAVAVTEAVKDVSSIQPLIKWPNDVLWEGKKLAGILVESVIKGKQLEFIVVGIGMNVNTGEGQIPGEGISLKEITVTQYDVKNMLDHVLNRFAFWYDSCAEQGFQQLITKWKMLCQTIGQQIQYHDGEEMIEGTAVDLAEDGAILIRCADGNIVRKYSGVISHTV